MKYILILGWCLVGILTANAQQEEQYSLFYLNKGFYNAGYVGSEGGLGIAGVYRKQWFGLDGAPSSQQISLDGPLLNRRIGLGANITRQSIGITERYTISGQYAYRVLFARGMLGIGLQASLRYQLVDFRSDKISGLTPLSIDPSIPTDNETKLLPNFGAGLYFNDERFYIGVSCPRIINNSLSYNSQPQENADETRHYYLYSGYTFNKGKTVEITPHVLAKFEQHSPFDIDFALNFELDHRFFIGGQYRLGGNVSNSLGSAMTVMAGAQFNSSWMLGMGYDFSMARIRKYENGSLELLLKYRIMEAEEGEIQNPRYF